MYVCPFQYVVCGTVYSSMSLSWWNNFPRETCLPRECFGFIWKSVYEILCFYSIPWKLQVCCTYCQQLSCKLRHTFTMRLQINYFIFDLIRCGCAGGGGISKGSTDKRFQSVYLPFLDHNFWWWYEHIVWFVTITTIKPYTKFLAEFRLRNIKVSASVSSRHHWSSCCNIHENLWHQTPDVWHVIVEMLLPQHWPVMATFPFSFCVDCILFMNSTFVKLCVFYVMSI